VARTPNIKSVKVVKKGAPVALTCFCATRGIFLPGI
jgi:hypothetical protein